MSSFKKLNMGAAQGVVALSGFIKFIKKERNRAGPTTLIG
jgi:hypothetical protein